MKLFHIAGTCSVSPHIALLEAGIPFELCRVDRETKQVKGVGDYNQINTKGSVPAIQLDDGRVLTEGAAIVQYIADQAPAKNLYPAATPLRNRVPRVSTKATRPSSTPSSPRMSARVSRTDFLRALVGPRSDSRNTPT